MGVKCTLCA